MENFQLTTLLLCFLVAIIQEKVESNSKKEMYDAINRKTSFEVNQINFKILLYFFFFFIIFDFSFLSKSSRQKIYNI